MFNASNRMGTGNPYEASEVSHEEGYDNFETGGFNTHYHPHETHEYDRLETNYRPRLADFAGPDFWTATPYESQEYEYQYAEDYEQHEPQHTGEMPEVMRRGAYESTGGPPDLNKTEDEADYCKEVISTY